MEDSTLKYYEENAEDVTERYEKIDMSVTHQKLLEFLPKNKQNLELGCGSGREASFLLAHGYDVLISDGSQKMLDQAIRLHPELDGRHYLIQLPDKFPFKEKSFGAVYAIAVLMHLEIHEIHLVLNEISRVLQKKGLLFFSVPIKRDDLFENKLDQNGRRFLMMPIYEWVKTCETAGFSLHSLYEDKDKTYHNIKWYSFLFNR